jgi:hypothetical protein
MIKSMKKLLLFTIAVCTFLFHANEMKAQNQIYNVGGITCYYKNQVSKSKYNSICTLCENKALNLNCRDYLIVGKDQAVPIDFTKIQFQAIMSKKKLEAVPGVKTEKGIPFIQTKTSVYYLFPSGSNTVSMLIATPSEHLGIMARNGSLTPEQKMQKCLRENEKCQFTIPSGCCPPTPNNACCADITAKNLACVRECRRVAQGKALAADQSPQVITLQLND